MDAICVYPVPEYNFDALLFDAFSALYTYTCIYTPITCIYTPITCIYTPITCIYIPITCVDMLLYYTKIVMY